jgi:hypothetical protein
MKQIFRESGVTGHSLNTAEAVARLQKAANSNTQNATILYLGNKPKSTLTIVENGFGSRMDRYVNHLSGENSKTCFDFEKKTPEVPLNNETKALVPTVDFDSSFKALTMAQDILESVKWEAKVFTVSFVASGNTILGPQAILALYTYTAFPELSKIVNDQIFQDNVQDALRPYSQQLYHALTTLDPFEGEVYIGANNVDRRLYRTGTEISWPVFTSASTMWRAATENTKEFATAKKQGTVFIVHSKTGRLISSYSKFLYDMEVIFLPSSKFRVVNWYMGDVICLGQANIREHTFKVKEENMERMLTTNTSLIIELAEQ